MSRQLASRAAALAIVVTALSASPAIARAQSPDLRAADSLFAAGLWADAEQAYATWLARDSTDQRANFRLAVSLFEQRRFREALPHFQRAAAAGFQVVMARFRMTRALAQLDERRLALDHLELAVAVGVPLELVQSHPDIAGLRSEPRYADIVRRMEDARYPCRSRARARQLDFWNGEWNVYSWDATSQAAPVGISTVRSALEQCLVIEEWTPREGLAGRSMNFWDLNRSRWRQIWVAADGTALDFDGAFANDEMTFLAWSLAPTGQRIRHELTLRAIGPDTVRQRFRESADNGSTWRVTFDGRYVRRPPTAH